jgi:DNA-binding NtrC family response regulator
MYGNWPRQSRTPCCWPIALDLAPASGAAAVRPAPFARRLCTLKENDEGHVAYVLTNTGGDRKQAARILGITVRQLQRKLAQMRRDAGWLAYLDDSSTA